MCVWQRKTKQTQGQHSTPTAQHSHTHTSFSPWIIVKANNKRKARLESIRYTLSVLDYEGKDSAKVGLFPDPNVVTRFHRSAIKID